MEDCHRGTATWRSPRSRRPGSDIPRDERATAGKVAGADQQHDEQQLRRETSHSDGCEQHGRSAECLSPGWRVEELATFGGSMLGILENESIVLYCITVPKNTWGTFLSARISRRNF